MSLFVTHFIYFSEKLSLWILKQKANQWYFATLQIILKDNFYLEISDFASRIKEIFCFFVTVYYSSYRIFREGRNLYLYDSESFKLIGSLDEIDNSPSVLSLFYDESSKVVFATGKVNVFMCPVISYFHRMFFSLPLWKWCIYNKAISHKSIPFNDFCLI